MTVKYGNVKNLITGNTVLLRLSDSLKSTTSINGFHFYTDYLRRQPEGSKPYILIGVFLASDSFIFLDYFLVFAAKHNYDNKIIISAKLMLGHVIVAETRKYLFDVSAYHLAINRLQRPICV